MRSNKTSAEFFEAIYSSNADPWGFATNKYELNRYKHIYEALKYKRYESIFEPGCSIGVLTERLSTLADYVDAFDFSSTASKLAQIRCAHLKNVSIRCESLVNAKPDSRTDLLVLSEVGYYFEASEWAEIVIKLVQNSSKSLTVLACHWLQTSADHLLSGDEVHKIITSIKGLEVQYSERHREYRLDRWEKQK